MYFASLREKIVTLTSRSIKVRHSFYIALKVQKPTALVSESTNALGIGAASFARLELQTSDYGLRFFLSEEKTKASKDIAESPTRSGTPKE